MAKSDVNFVHALHAQANARVSRKVDALFIIIVSFFVGVILWASLSEIDELARGEGKVIPSEKIQTLQNLDGGVVSHILVKEGEHVSKNQALMRIDTTRFQASLEENRQAYWSGLVKKVRLEAEYNINPKDEIPSLKFSKRLQKDAQSFIVNEEIIFFSRIEEFQSTLEILESQLAQKVQEIIEMRGTKTQLEKSRLLTLEELDTIEQLVKSGAKSKIELITIKKELNSIDGDIRATELSIPRANLAVKEAKNKIIEKLKNFKSEAILELQEVNAEIKKLESKLVAERDKLAKTVITSPVHGIIKIIHINTIGGVVKSGMDLIEIVPDSDVLLIEAKIDPKDIAFINPSLKAIIKLTAYDFSIYGGLEGEIIEISADSIIDEKSKDQKSYYKIVLKTNKNYLEKDGKKLPIIPGMVASVDIVTGKKTILDFILKPILKTKQGALHER
ncbi:MAG: HlyD family type I secretion periplasmic adaptor subunit [Campylobacteraceae bacterium]|nr:HlyD family type I secretion periplasmic adaptor subunit [Campylobacteraceae bacterium]